MTFTRNVCAFCGGGPTTDEHVWPEWIEETIESVAGEPVVYDAAMGTDEGDTREWSTTKFNIAVNRFCEHCNTGWMSQLEHDTKHILTPMMLGERNVITLSASDQDILGRWAYKTALTADFAFLNALDDDSATPIPADIYRDFYKTKQPPAHVTIWTIAREVAKPTFGGLRSYQVISPNEPKGDETQFLYLVTIVVAFAVFQVAIISPAEGAPTPRAYSRIPKLWPLSDRSLNWPAEGGALAASELVDFARRKIF